MTCTDRTGNETAHTGFGPRALATPYRGFRISPRRIQAWHEVNEMPDRELMRDGCWFGLTPRPSALRGRDPEAPRAEAKENQTSCARLVGSSQATPTQDRERGPA
jgi:hypothetical protein